MNEALTLLLQQKLGLTEAQVESLRQGDPSALAAHLSSGGSDPLLIALAASMIGRSGAAPDPSASDPDRNTLERAKRIIQKLKEDLAAADTMVKYVAQVFGACPTCWGMNQFCLRCHGEGKPGTGEPIEAVLFQWVQPALKKLGWQVVQVSEEGPRQ